MTIHTYMVDGQPTTIRQIVDRTGLSVSAIWRAIARGRDTAKPLAWSDFPKPLPQRRGPRPPRRPASGPRKPTAAQNVSITPPATRPAPPARRTQTLDEWLAAGGQIEVIPPHHSAIGLRFDHSHTQTPIGKRRPVARARPAATL